mmetsp:Transcript_25476/g.59207  ORF Transcript_25476/g.59207 Transcript_25476/m.59207 type:complete len:144 (+) Transcript_25476:771-1202(+)
MTIYNHDYLALTRTPTTRPGLLSLAVMCKFQILCGVCIRVFSQPFCKYLSLLQLLVCQQKVKQSSSTYHTPTKTHQMYTSPDTRHENHNEWGSDVSILLPHSLPSLAYATTHSTSLSAKCITNFTGVRGTPLLPSSSASFGSN